MLQLNLNHSKDQIMEILEYFSTFWELTNAMALYILFGLLFAGILHEIISDNLITKHLGKNDISSVIKATIFGIPIPVCSCGVIPLATSIKKSGASKGSVLSFLISTPITGIDSIFATYGIFGWIFTIYRILTSIIIAIIAGVLVNIFDKNVKNDNKIKFYLNTQSINKSNLNITPSQIQKNRLSCCNDNSCCENNSNSNKKFSLISAFKYGFLTLLEDIAIPLFWGLVIGAFITMFIPKDLSNILIQNGWLSYIIVIIIAIPMYVCATASLPIGAAFILSGVSVGASFVFLSAGPATNSVTISVVKNMLGKKAVLIYLFTIAIGSIIFGLGLDYIFDINNLNPKKLIHIDENFGIISIISSIVLLSFLGYFIVKKYFYK